ncbi:MAG: hypothetical protein ACI4V1_01960 [Eubacteriales bacterium]
MNDMTYTDPCTMAYINLYGVLGGLTALCETVPEARKILGKNSCSIGFAVKNGPSATLTFVGGRCIVKDGVENCAVRLPFSSCEKFNGMVAGTVTPVPSHGFTKLPFLLSKFKKLTDLLEQYLRPAPDALEDETFLRQSTAILFRVIACAVAQIANHDRVGQASASYIVDGPILLEIEGLTKAALIAKNHTLTFSDKVPKTYLSYMKFADVKVARDLFDGKINSVAAVGAGDVRIGGMISQIDNVNRILSRVELYLK